ncbi:hypothetical protein QA584_04740 [Anaerocolumna sp. AGMB13025]|uniref:hypothetical protein n=1 Tax=Anaerocolumna sp. AGMB13025 TaxID=3039116 RepID=UPI00241C128C|nr:hypothetical protein [Anaerocolumna sp. AGMB13025]WFR58381.1 hypothetical protein QA584_04740 [Anaerocolumna sp. AGMB13025]
MKKKLTIISLFVVVAFGLLFISTGGKRTDIMLTDYSVSENGDSFTIKVAVASSMGYVRTRKEKQVGDSKYITFYQTYGLNSTIGANNKFQIKLNPSCRKIYFYRGDRGYDLMLQKNDETNEWQLAIDDISSTPRQK